MSAERSPTLSPAIQDALLALLHKTRYEVRWMTDAPPDAVVQLHREQFSAIAPCSEFMDLVWALKEEGYGL